MRYRLGIDVGGTHTDMVLSDAVTGRLAIEKLPSTPGNPAVAVLEGLERFLARGIAPAEIGFFAHGTTVTTNALLEMKGARVGLLINRGMGGVLEVQTQGRDGVSPFDHYFKKPPPLVRPRFIREVGGRLDYAGREIEPLDEAAVRAAGAALRDLGVQSFCICFLFSFMNPEHERRAQAILREVAPGLPVSRSSAVLPRIREWPRFSTTLLNAYLAPVLARYCRDIAEGLDRREVATPQRFLMQSNGGVMPLTADAETHTARTLLSGPAAGVHGAAYLLGAEQGWRNLVTMDIGGTSCDIAFVEEARALEHAEAVIDGRLVGLPALDVATVAAGGGSIAWVGGGGLLEVGPRSAGAAPGPACYGRGGTEPTLTDADLLTGALNPDYFLGGKSRLDPVAAERAIAALARPLGMDVSAAAQSIVRIIDARITDAIRVEAAKKGIDLTGFTLVPFGGAGPVHAARVAADLGIPRILVPPNPGAFSALGLLATDVVHDYLRSELVALADLPAERAEAAFRALETEAMREMAAEGLPGKEARFWREMDLRYAGQGYELRVSLEGLGNPLDAAALRELGRRFHEQHALQHGHSAADSIVEAVSYRLRAVVAVPKYRLRPVADSAEAATPRGSRAGSTVWRRDDLKPGWCAAGPLIVEQPDATTVVPAGWSARADGYGNLLLERQA
jgi:N-methylhydantoinase A